MAKINDTNYIVVHDIKAHRNGHRLSVIETTSEANLEIFPVTVSDWKHADGRASDLESICRIPGKNNEFLAAESGHWDGKFGRLFHIRLEGLAPPYSASIIKAYDLPEFDAKGPDDPFGDEFEGMECVMDGENQLLVFLAERGGSPAYPAGLVRWFNVNTANQTITWTSDGERGVPVDPPGIMDSALTHRDISAMYLDGNNQLWGVSAEDAGDSGPFNSYLYQIGSIEPGSNPPFQPIRSPVAHSIMSGLKTEALAGPSAEVPASRFSISTEDECLGGVWRSLK
ncbi:MAG TPA: hypothetical protein VJ984_00865 [Xanthomonadales bacterium]|nr:hypothetical protein [Xanthomonadales bacterium]